MIQINKKRKENSAQNLRGSVYLTYIHEKNNFTMNQDYKLVVPLHFWFNDSLSYFKYGTHQKSIIEIVIKKTSERECAS